VRTRDPLALSQVSWLCANQLQSEVVALPHRVSAVSRSRAKSLNSLVVGETGFEPATPWSRTAIEGFSPRETAIPGVASPGNPEDRSAFQDTQSTSCDDLRSKICRPGVAIEKAPGLELPLLSIKEVAAQLGVCRAVAYRLCEDGELPHIRISNAIRVAPAAVAAYLASRGRS